MDGLQNKNVLLLGQALLVRPQGGISGGLILSNWSLTGCAQRQLHNTEVQTKLYTAIDDHGLLLTNLRGLNKTRKDAEKADKVDRRYGVTLQFRKR